MRFGLTHELLYPSRGSTLSFRRSLLSSTHTNLLVLSLKLPILASLLFLLHQSSGYTRNIPYHVTTTLVITLIFAYLSDRTPLRFQHRYWTALIIADLATLRSVHVDFSEIRSNRFMPSCTNLSLLSVALPRADVFDVKLQNVGSVVFVRSDRRKRPLRF